MLKGDEVLAREGQRIRSELVRNTIISTALEMGKEEGFDSISIRKIINKMQYSTGVVYHHFKDKQEILDAIEMEETKKLYARIATTHDDKKDFLYNTKAVFHMITRLAYEEPEIYNLVVLRKYRRKEDNHETHDKSSKPMWIAKISESIEKGIKSGLIKEMDPMRAAYSVWSSFLGLNLLISYDKDLTIEEVEDMFQVHMNIILKGILKHE